MKIRPLYAFILLFALSLTACKKKKKPVIDETSREDLTRDSIFLYAKEVYLWYNLLPTYEAFNPRKFNTSGTPMTNYENELIAIAKTAVNSSTGRYYEYFANGTDTKFSYISDKSDKNPAAVIPGKRSAVDLDGNGNDFGIKLGAYYLDESRTTFALFATAVYPGSPADQAGMTRSNRITKLNGRDIGANLANQVDFINDALSGSGTTMQIEGTKYLNGQNNGTYSVNLTKSVYRSSPVIGRKVFTAGSKKIGYFNFARFSTLSNARTDLEAAFTQFANESVTDLIIDLRYNTGGYVSTAQFLLNLIASPSLNGKVMFSEHYNGLMQTGQSKILTNQPLLDASGKPQYQNGRLITYADVDYGISANTVHFAAQGSLNGVQNVVFIVSGSTASASELVINSLKPYVNVKVIGTKTYGKPVGFFPITIENKYEVYYSMFTTKNSAGYGDYFDGMTPDIVDSYDDPLYNFGEAGENYTAQALNLLAPGVNVTSSATKIMALGSSSIPVRNLSAMVPVNREQEFVGMIETRHTLKK